MKPFFQSIIVAALLMSGLGPAFAADVCPLCGGTVVKAETLPDDPTQPSRNLSVWYYEGGTNVIHEDQTLVCTQCWFSFEPSRPVVWRRFSQQPDSFYHPLSDAIRHFPMPDPSPTYGKMFEGVQTNETYCLVTVPGGKGKDVQWSEISSSDCAGVKVQDSMNFGCKDSKERMTKLHDYCAQHALSLDDRRDESHPGEVSGSIMTQPMPCRPRSAAVVKPKDLSLVPPPAARLCPLCGGSLAKAVSVNDDIRKPSKNICLWNRSGCGNPAYSEKAVICTQCWFSFSPGWSEAWERCSQLPDSFRYPLSNAIRHFPAPVPTPPTWIVYGQKYSATQTNDTTRVMPLPGDSGKEIRWRVIHSQKYSDVRIQEEINFWCKGSKEQIAKFRDYCAKHELSVKECEAKTERGEVLFKITTKLMPYHPSSAAAVKPKGNKP